MSNINLNGNDMNNVNTDNGENNTSSEEGEMTIYNNGYDENGKILTREALADLIFGNSGFGEAVTGAILARATKVVGKWTLITDRVDGEKREVYIQTSSLPEGFGKGVRVAFEDGVSCDRVVRVKSGEHFPQAIVVVDRLDIVGEDMDLGIHPVADSADGAVNETDAAVVPEADEAVVADAEETTDEVAPAQPKKKAWRGKRGGRRNRGKRGGNALKADNAAKPASAGKSKSRKRPSAYEQVKNAYIENRPDVAAMRMKGIVVSVFQDKDGNTVVEMTTGSYNSPDTNAHITARDEEQGKWMRALKPDDYITVIPNPLTSPNRSADLSDGEIPAFDIERGFSLKLEKGVNEREDGEAPPHLPAPSVFFETVVGANGLTRDAYGQLIVPATPEETKALLAYAGRKVKISGLLDIHNPTTRDGVFRIHKVRVDDKDLVAKGLRGNQAGFRRGNFIARANQRAA